MNPSLLNTKSVTLLIGDTLILGLVTLIGFASHGTLTSGGWRILVNFFSFAAAWLIAAYALNLFHMSFFLDWKRVLQILWAVLLAAPLAGWLRGLWLGRPSEMVFVAVMGAVSALGLLVWRFSYSIWTGRKRQLNG